MALLREINICTLSAFQLQLCERNLLLCGHLLPKLPTCLAYSSKPAYPGHEFRNVIFIIMKHKLIKQNTMRHRHPPSTTSKTLRLPTTIRPFNFDSSLKQRVSLTRSRALATVARASALINLDKYIENCRY